MSLRGVRRVAMCGLSSDAALSPRPSTRAPAIAAGDSPRDARRWFLAPIAGAIIGYKQRYQRQAGEEGVSMLQAVPPNPAPDPIEEPDWWALSPYASEIAALGPAGKRALIEMERQCDNLQQLMLLAVPTARMADRMDWISQRINKDGLTYSGKPNRLLGEMVRVEKMYLQNLRSMGFCDKDPVNDKNFRKSPASLW